MIFFFFKQKTAYEMRISDWSSDVCSSDLPHRGRRGVLRDRVDCAADPDAARDIDRAAEAADLEPRRILAGINAAADDGAVDYEAEIGAGSGDGADGDVAVGGADPHGGRSEEHTSELQSLMRISYAVFGLKKKKNDTE